MTKKVVFKFKDCCKEISVGDTVFMHNCNKHHNNIIVKKIGRDLVHFSNNTSFYIKTGYERSDYGHNSLYSSEIVYRASIERENYFYKINGFLSLKANQMKITEEEFNLIKNVIEKY